MKGEPTPIGHAKLSIFKSIGSRDRMDRIAVVLNSENHTIGKEEDRNFITENLANSDPILADLPGETLENIFRNLRGLDLINLTKVCQNFNDAIGQSPMCMNKVRVKVSWINKFYCSTLCNKFTLDF